MADGGTERLFVAVALTEEARAAIAAHLRASLPGGVPGRVPPAANWHLTMRFLGAASRAERNTVRGALAAADLGPAFDLVFGGLGAFPNPRRARVLWLGVDEGADRLRDLAATAESAARSAGFAPEEKRFTPHLTLSRMQPARPVADEVARVPPLGLRMPVRELVIYRSHLGGGPARYEAVEHFALR
ncbi:MAG TPA: RNA 2',3'-cyclic phosphodiesterase [Longimicrobium sp.]|jgi:2'-5' RNA ligase|uniref:RNA 2',3'-cyclic phosphodiesterase n=1 Tax=Longimicrobium sp. TaxID=2029185 RepID=UPI002ED8405E